MDTLESVLAQKSEYIVRELSRRPALAGGRAERFAAEAGSDLIASFRWQAADLDAENLSARVNVRRLLAAMRANGIANRLGMPPADVWDGLRIFVPLVLQMAERRTGRVPALRGGAGGGTVTDAPTPRTADRGSGTERERHWSWRIERSERRHERTRYELANDVPLPGRRSAPTEPPAA